MCLEWPDCITSHRGSKRKARKTRREGGVGGGKVLLVREETWHSLYLFSLAPSFASILIFPNRLTEGRPANRGKLCKKLQRSREDARSQAALWNSWVDPVVTQGSNKGRTHRLTHALSAGACTHLHTDLQWQERECALPRQPWSSSHR